MFIEKKKWVAGLLLALAVVCLASGCSLQKEAASDELWGRADAKEIDIVLEQDGVLNPIEIKKTSNPGTELTKVFSLLDKASVPRGKGAIVCMKPKVGVIDRDNYIVPIWTI